MWCRPSASSQAEASAATRWAPPVPAHDGPTSIAAAAWMQARRVNRAPFIGASVPVGVREPDPNLQCGGHIRLGEVLGQAELPTGTEHGFRPVA